MAFEQFHCVVIGDEPAGLWLLAKLEKELIARGEVPRLGWVSLRSTPRPVCLPSSIAKAFGIGTAPVWSAELVSPKRSFTWNRGTVRELFPQFAALAPGRSAIDALVCPNKEEKQQLRKAIVAHPSLVGFAQGLARMLSRARDLSPEAAVHQSRVLYNLQWWEPHKDLGSQTEHYFADPKTDPIKGFENVRGQGLGISFEKGPRWSSRHWILNLDTHELDRLCVQCPEFLTLANVHTEATHLGGLYPLQARVEAGTIPSCVSPLAVVFDTELVPDPTHEIWPITFSKEGASESATVWGHAPGQASLEAISEQLRQGMGRMQRVLPFMPSRLLEVSPPLGTQTCFDPAQRQAVLTYLEDNRIEQYPHTAHLQHTRSPFVAQLLPHLGCHLPYPLGTLLGAAERVPMIAGKKPSAGSAARQAGRVAKTTRPHA